MDRRATIASLLGRPPAKAQAPPVPILNSGLEPYVGPWGYEQAAHLLRRAMFGPAYEQIKTAAELGLATTLQQLFEERPLPEPPLNHNNQNDPAVPIGATWVDAPYSTAVNLRPYRMQSLRAWTMQQLFQEGVSIREQLTLFWHNHFGVANVNDAKFRYIHANLLRSNAWGNFRELIKAVTIDPTMLRFLNGNQNTRNSPNENYARELLELFTIGKGPQAARAITPTIPRKTSARWPGCSLAGATAASTLPIRMCRWNLITPTTGTTWAKSSCPNGLTTSSSPIWEPRSTPT
jgi:hypothetical protein